MIKLIVLISIFVTLLLFVIPVRVNALGLNEICEANGQNYGECTPPLKCVVQSEGQEGRVSWCQPASAGSVFDVFGKITLPPAIRNLGTGSAAISLVLSNIVTLIFIAAGIVFLFMIVISAFQFITSGGDKEAVGKARGRLTWAIIGITILALAFVIVRTVAEITGFNM